jgi:transposase
MDRAVTIIVDLTRDQDGCLHARHLDAVVGWSATAYKTWPQKQPDGFTANRRRSRVGSVPRLPEHDP